MPDIPGSPIVSIYDLLLERKILLAGRGSFRRQRNNQPEEASEPIAETSTKAKAISRSISEHLSCASDVEAKPSGPSHVSASHLTKKRTGVILQQSAKKELIEKLPKKVAPRIFTAKSKSATPSVAKNISDASSTSKPMTSTRRKKKKKVHASGGSTPKSNSIEQHSADQQRMPMSPRKAGGDIQARAKTPTTPTKLTPKPSQTKLRLKGRKSKASLATSKTPTTPSSVNRWRI